jgi:hypothetical protein
MCVCVCVCTCIYIYIYIYIYICIQPYFGARECIVPFLQHIVQVDCAIRDMHSIHTNMTTDTHIYTNQLALVLFMQHMTQIEDALRDIQLGELTPHIKELIDSEHVLLCI